MCIYEIYHIHKLISFAGPWMQLETIILDDERQAQKDKYRTFLICDAYRDTHNHKYKYDMKAGSR